MQAGTAAAAAASATASQQARTPTASMPIAHMSFVLCKLGLHNVHSSIDFHAEKKYTNCLLGTQASSDIRHASCMNLAAASDSKVAHSEAVLTF